MSQPTGNRWRDPDTGEIANPGNIDLSTYKGKDAAKRRYGPAVLGTPEEQAEAAAAAAAPKQDPLERARAVEAGALARAHAKTGVVVETGDDLPVAKPKLGPAFLEHEPPKADASVPPLSPALGDDMDGIIRELAEHGRLARQGEAAAVARLNEIAQQEAEREGGPRLPIVNRLHAYGVSLP